MNLIELHILQSFPVTCLNRDDVGAPKSAIFGGEVRARVSSQSWKRAIRLLAAETCPELFAGRRGHYLAQPLQESIEQLGVESDTAQEWAESVVSHLGGQDKKHKDDFRTAVSLFLSPLELEAVATAVAPKAQAGDDVDLKRGDVRKALDALPARDMADIAIFGRFVADDSSVTLEGAGMFSHALSTHAVRNDIDFFSAVDDTQAADDSGAGHIGTLEFNSACYYRYIGLNRDLLADPDHLGHLNQEDLNRVIESFLRACILAVPGARQNSMLGHNPPSCVLGRRRAGQPISLANAFEEPVRSHKGIVQPSVEALKGHSDRLGTLYAMKSHDAWLDASDPKSMGIDELIGELVSD